ncbi:MAG: oligoendopeptidase F [Anaerolineales bacterium]|nr:oligoendopeptidase F [Anaerolineales bacterium]MCB9127364.1 oligoendopeptidase F [Ardenticatenales bacterium]MCB9172699.1 oligoendopeptidase F [Ardenticatenales bacterium]
MTTKLRERSEIPEDYLWDTNSIFPNEPAWRAALEQNKKTVSRLAGYAGRLSEGPETLFEALERSMALNQRVNQIYLYPSLNSAADMRDQESRAMGSQAANLVAKFRTTTAFIVPEILAIGEETIRQWIADYPKLERYRHYVENLFRLAPHYRSAEVEAVLGGLSEPFGSVSETAAILANAEINFADATDRHGKAAEMGQGMIRAYLSSTDRELRRTAWNSYADGYLAFKNTLTNNLKTAVQQDVFEAQVRGYDSALEASLSPHNIPVEVFHNLIDTFKRHLPTWHRYWRIRRKALGVDELHPYDVWAPITANEPHVPYEQAVDWIAEGMLPLGHDYVDVLRRGSLEERWVDVYPNKGKRQGAFSSGVPGTYPFLLVSYTDDIRSLSTLAHELGHSMHSYLTWDTQPLVYSRYSLFAAEVASNFSQAMTRAHLLATQPDPDFQIALIEEAMTNFHRYFFIMPTLARFELTMHRMVEAGQGITADGLIELCASLYDEGYGGEMAFDRERQGINWATFNHLYANFYVFQYATGISGAHALSEKVLAGDDGAADAYLDFLRAGSSGYAMDVLKEAGVDLSTPAPIETTFGVMESYIDRLEALTK